MGYKNTVPQRSSRLSRLIELPPVASLCKLCLPGQRLGPPCLSSWAGPSLPGMRGCPTPACLPPWPCAPSSLKSLSPAPDRGHTGHLSCIGYTFSELQVVLGLSPAPEPQPYRQPPDPAQPTVALLPLHHAACARGCCAGVRASRGGRKRRAEVITEGGGWQADTPG